MVAGYALVVDAVVCRQVLNRSRSGATDHHIRPGRLKSSFGGV